MSLAVDEKEGAMEHSDLALRFAPEGGGNLRRSYWEKGHSPTEYADVWVISANVTELRSGPPTIPNRRSGNKFLFY